MKVIFKKEKNKEKGVLLHRPSESFIFKGEEYTATMEQVLRNVMNNNAYTPCHIKGDFEANDAIDYITNYARTLKLKGAFVMFKDGVPFDYIIVNNQFRVLNKISAKREALINIHKRHNAPKKVKLRQAVGRERVQAFKLYAMGIKPTK